MPYELPLPQQLRRAGWKVKIHDAEGPEDPHVTIYRKRRKWRWSLRKGRFLDPHDKWSQIDSTVRQLVAENAKTLRQKWDRLHPHNPVSSEDEA